MLNTNLNTQYHPVTHTYYPNHHICIEEIWCGIIQNKYLGKKRMTKIFDIIMDQHNIIYDKRFKEYKKYHMNEWFTCDEFELYKCSSGYFKLTYYYYDEISGRRKEMWTCYFDLNLVPYYHSENDDVRIAYHALSDDYNADIIRYKDKYKK